VSDRLAAQCVSLPVFPELTVDEKDAVAAALADFLEENR
jgi:dTDP-4-amino-4,6-dideoxygalactose transaminase